MKEKLQQLLNGAKTLKQAESILKNNNIKYCYFEGIGGSELQIKEDSKTHRILKNKKSLEIKTLVKAHIEIDSVDLYKAKLIQSYK